MSKKRLWWQDQDDPALDDDVEVVEQDDNGDWIDNFRFSDYRADRGLSSTDAIWKRYGYSGSTFADLGASSMSRMSKGLGIDYATAKKVEAAQRLVQGFVDTFALENPLKARFSERRPSATAEADAKDVIVSHRPLLDPTIAEDEAHRIMTAQAANAAARARFGGDESTRRTKAVRREVSSASALDAGIADELATILDGHRIDSMFRRDYPGYEDVYAPAQAYIARGLLKGRASFELEDFKGASIANAALNFDAFTDWTGRETEREWWSTWADHYAYGTVDQFVDGVLEGVAHLHEDLPPKPQGPGGPDQPKEKGDEKGDGGQPSGSDEKGEDEKQDEDEGEDGKSDNEKGEDEKQDEDEDEGEDGKSRRDSEGGDQGGEDTETGDGGGQTGGVELPTGLGDGVAQTGLANGQRKGVDPEAADQAAEAANALAMGRNESEIGEVYWSAAGLVRQVGGRVPRHKVRTESSANGYIRRAFTRSRTAHFATQRGHKNGRIDNRSLPRIASDDYRLFSKRTAPSETRYLVWLLVDNSGSMGGQPVIDAMNLSASVALAVRHVPNVRLDVWAWTSGIRIPNARFSAVRVYADGDPVAKIGDTAILGQGGTPDNAVLSWAAREILKQCRPGEVPVIIMASDGQGGLASEAMYRDPATHERWGYSPEQIASTLEQVGADRVAAARKSGVKVLCVAIGELDHIYQDLVYGKGNHIKWQGSIKAMAKPLGDLLARVASNRVK